LEYGIAGAQRQGVPEEGGRTTYQDRCQPPRAPGGEAIWGAAFGAAEQPPEADDEGQEQRQEGQVGEIVAEQELGAVIGEELADFGQGGV
jgi:hypothetical protein